MKSKKVPLLLILSNLLGVVRFGILEEDHILQPTDEHELIEGARLGLRSCRGDQSKRISLPEVAVTIGFEPEGNLIICGDEIKGRYRRQPRQAKAGRSETSIGDCSLRKAHFAAGSPIGDLDDDGIMPRVHTSEQPLTRG